MRKASRYAFLLLLCTFAQSQTTTQTPAKVPQLVKYSGIAAENQKTVSITFSIYDQVDATTPIWSEIQTAATDDSGHYSVMLGSIIGLPDTLFASGEARWLGVQAAGQKEQGRVALVSVPYAMKAADAETLGGKPLSAFVLADNPKAARLTGSSETSRALPEPTCTSGSGCVTSLSELNATAFTIPQFSSNAGELINSNFSDSGTFATVAVPLNVVGTSANLSLRNSVASGYGGLRIYNDQNVGNRTLEIDYSGSAYSSNLVSGGPTGESASLTTTGPFPLTLGTSNTARVTINGSGSVGIGTPSPSATLDVNGNFRLGGSSAGVIESILTGIWISSSSTTVSASSCVSAAIVSVPGAQFYDPVFNSFGNVTPKQRVIAVAETDSVEILYCNDGTTSTSFGNGVLYKFVVFRFFPY